MLKNHKKLGKCYSAICASPAFVFEPHGFFSDEVGTCHPSLVDMLKNKSKID